MEKVAFSFAMNIHPCIRCGLSCVLSRDTTADNGAQVFWWCNHCWNYADPSRPFVARSHVKLFYLLNPDDLPQVVRYPNAPKPRCEVCGTKGAQEHHWAPKHLFDGEAENWPKSWLCTKCHTLWHNTVTPEMSTRGQAAGHG